MPAESVREEFAANHQKNEKISGKIKSITDFGIFVGLEGGIDELIHLSDLSCDRPGERRCATIRRATILRPSSWQLIPEARSVSRSVSSSLTAIRSPSYVAANGRAPSSRAR